MLVRIEFEEPRPTKVIRRRHGSIVGEITELWVNTPSLPVAYQIAAKKYRGAVVARATPGVKPRTARAMRRLLQEELK